MASVSIIAEVSAELYDSANSIWTSGEVGVAVDDGYGFVSYGARTEADGNTRDKSLAKMFAKATLMRALARDRSRFFKWASAQGTSADKTSTPTELRELADDLMDDVAKALQQDIDRSKSDVQLSGPTGGRLDFGKNAPAHSDRNFDRRLNRYNRPSDR